MTMTVLSVLMFLCFLSTAFDNPSTVAKIGVSRVAVDRANDFSQTYDANNDLGLITIDLEVSGKYLCLISTFSVTSRSLVQLER